MSSDFLTSTIPYFGVIGISDALLLYAAYLSFSVWRGLSVPVYRSRAIWNGMLAIILGLGLTASGNVGLFSPRPYYLLVVIAVYGILYPFAILVLYFWVDRTLSTIVRLDYLRRDLLGWRRFRYLYWAFAAGALVSYFLFISTAPPASSDALVLLVLNIVSSAVYVVPFGYATFALVVGVRRTRDTTFRLHLRWFGFTIASLVIIVVVYTLTPDPFIGSLPYLPVSYGFYKMARSLVPVQRLNLEDRVMGAKAAPAGPDSTTSQGASP